MRKNARLQVVTLPKGYEDSNGDWHYLGDTDLRESAGLALSDSMDDTLTLTGEEADTIACYAEPAGQPSERTFADGVTRQYTFTVYLAPRCRTFRVGERVRLYRHDQEFDLEVKGFMPYQLQPVLWLG